MPKLPNYLAEIVRQFWGPNPATAGAQLYSVDDLNKLAADVAAREREEIAMLADVVEAIYTTDPEEAEIRAYEDFADLVRS